MLNFIDFVVQSLSFEILLIIPANLQAQTGRRPGGTRRGLVSSRSAEDLLSSTRLRLSKSTVTLGELPAKVTPQVVTTCAEYSEVWDPGDSGISSTSDSTVSYNNKKADHELEDLSKVPWYESEMPR